MRPPASARLVLTALVVAGLATVSPAVASRDRPRQGCTLRGAGATFPAPLYEKWIQAYRQDEPGGRRSRTTPWAAARASGAFWPTSVDFGASDAALSDEQMARVAGRRPAGAGHRGHRRARLQRARARPDRCGSAATSTSTSSPAGSARGTIRAFGPPTPTWTCRTGASRSSRARTAAGRRSPSPIISAPISEAWRDRGPGIGNLVDWRGTAMLARGNEGVAGPDQGQRGLDRLRRVPLRQAARPADGPAAEPAGRYVEPGERGRPDGADAAMPGRCRTISGSSCPTPTGRTSYPIVTFSWLLLYAHYPDARQGGGAQEVRTLEPHDGADATAVISATSRCRPRSRLCPWPRSTASTERGVTTPAPSPRTTASGSHGRRSLAPRAAARFVGINQRLAAHRDPLDDRVVDNMLAGYAFVDTLVADGHRRLRARPAQALAGAEHARAVRDERGPSRRPRRPPGGDRAAVLRRARRRDPGSSSSGTRGTRASPSGSARPVCTCGC